ncbi:MAG: hypothetical protein K9K66_05595 [Desulfarculaceae bacterium]|nr:hypothetical protein [Desulfarculaceae bacterium]MCF8071282.1 hypothetical protein [Desulfarculaceae bacterium]MCF8101115.1 hypothetical protein [Desulfarculaceae bacterium]MCF8115336.1 hypothetical protein [Desulfarculaceae bacterium]
MSQGAGQVGLNTQGPWLPSNPVPLPRRLSLYFLYAALALSLFSGHIHYSGLLVILGFVVVFQVATRPLTSDFLVRFPHYFVIIRVLLIIMCLGLALSVLPLPGAWRPLEQLAVSSLALIITVAWTVMVMMYLFQARQVRLDTIFSGVAAFFLLAIVWTELYKVLGFSQPDGFHPSLYPAPGMGGSVHLRALYYSLSTITTVGFGDILPKSATAQIISGLEAAAGQLFLAVLIARLVSRHLTTTMEPIAPLPRQPHQPRGAHLARRLCRQRRR